MRDVSADDVKTLVTGDNLTIVDCWAPWCGPCRVLKPRLESLSQDFEDVTFLALNVDNAADFTRQHNIRSIPTLLFYKGGEIVHTVTGAPNERSLQEKIEAYR